MLKTLAATPAAIRANLARDLVTAAYGAAYRQPMVRIVGENEPGPHGDAASPAAIGTAIGESFVACLAAMEAGTDAEHAAAIESLQALYDLATDVYAHTAWLKSERRDNSYPDPNGTPILVDDNGRSVYTLGQRLLELAVANGWEQPRG